MQGLELDSSSRRFALRRIKVVREVRSKAFQQGKVLMTGESKTSQAERGANVNAM